MHGEQENRAYHGHFESTAITHCHCLAAMVTAWRQSCGLGNLPNAEG